MFIPFQVTDWSQYPETVHAGESGEAKWKTLSFGDLRIRQVEYSANYKADHWCSKGHIIYCIEGEFTTELSDGRTFTLTPGMTYQVSDDLSFHRSTTKTGVKLLIIDGGFLGRKREFGFN
ncbi:MAG: DHCW motif cupin fold protein [Bacteroidota bacterium]